VCICISGVISKTTKSKGKPILAQHSYRPDVLMSKKNPYLISFVSLFRCSDVSPPPAPSHDCTTSYQHRYIDGVRCEWGCKHWCCQDSADLTCPKHSPTNPYCIGTHIVKYTINGRRCPVYCGCLPDCTVLTC
jgi:hypothetical protein